MGERFTKEAYEAIYRHPKWKEEARNYEEHLAAKLFYHNDTQAAVRTALTKISRVLTAYYGTEGKSLSGKSEEELEAAAAINDMAAETLLSETGVIQVNKTLVEALMQAKRDNTGAGQVQKRTVQDQKEDGTFYTQEEADGENLWTLHNVLNVNGNLREQMTLLYNGMFANGGYQAEQIRDGVSLKGVLLGVKEHAGMRDGLSDAFDYDLLEGMEQWKKGKDVFDTYALARDMEKREEKRTGKGSRLSRWWRGIKRAFDAAVWNRRRRLKREDGQGLGIAHYERLGIEPSKREMAFALETDADGRRQLRWKEGTAYFRPKREVTADGMLHTAGSSGTTLRMLGAYRMMGASQKELLDFRLALIAWMVSSRDHSLYEILKGSHNAGVKGSENLEEAAVMYTNIDPLDTRNLRENFIEGVRHAFPHEIIYQEMMNELYRMRLDKAMERVPEIAKTEGKSEAQVRSELEALKEEQIIEQAATDQMLLLKQLLKEKVMEDERLAEQDQMATEVLTEQDGGEFFRDDVDGERRREIIAYQKEIRKSRWTIMQEIPVVKEAYELAERKRRAVIGQDDWGRSRQYETLYMRSRGDQWIGSDARNVSAQALALNIYTTEAYVAMNHGEKWGEKGGKEKLKAGRYRGAQQEEREDDVFLEKVYDIVRISSKMAQDALLEHKRFYREEKHNNLKMYRGPVFRGEKGDGSRYLGGYETQTLTSFSQSLTEALVFYAEQAARAGVQNAVMVVYQMEEGDEEVDISGISAYGYEDEVLIPKGVRLEVKVPLKRNVRLDSILRSAESGGDGDYVLDGLQEDSQVSRAELEAEIANVSGFGETERKDGDIVKDHLKHINIVQLKKTNRRRGR